MRILVTRPHADAMELRAQLEARGHTVLVDPLLRVELVDVAVSRVEAVQAVVVTSRNALQSLARFPDLTTKLAGKPLYAVGPATATLGRAMGFAIVHEGPGDAAGLAALLGARLPASAGQVLYLSGLETAFDLPKALDPFRLAVQTAVVYRTEPAQALALAVLDGLNQAQIDAVVLLSVRSAQTYADLLVHHNQLENITNICHFCFSEAIAQALAPLGAISIRVARRPKVEELLALVGSEAKCL